MVKLVYFFYFLMDFHDLNTFFFVIHSPFSLCFQIWKILTNTNIHCYR